MDTQTIHNLLSQVSAINKKYEKIAEITGENFNIFKILRIESEEVLTHSRFLCELLNPKGLHGKGDLFLKQFIESQIDGSEENKAFGDKLRKFNSEKCSVKPEAHIGFKNADNTEGGRIDILMKDNSGYAIIIENKIYAGDQPQQLVRYSKAHPEAPIFYLTLYGSNPSKESAGHLQIGKDFKCISYQKDILEWLKNCRKEVVENPILRDAITQYINLIKYLTGQTMNDEMKKEIVDIIIKNAENIELAFEISKSLNGVKNQLKKVFENQIREISKDLDLEFCMLDSGFSLTPKKWNSHSIFFWYDGPNLLYGVHRNNWDNSLKRSAEIDNLLMENEYDEFKTHIAWLIVQNFYASIDNNELFWKDIKSLEAQKKARKFIELINTFNNEKY